MSKMKRDRRYVVVVTVYEVTRELPEEHWEMDEMVPLGEHKNRSRAMTQLKRHTQGTEKRRGIAKKMWDEGKGWAHKKKPKN